MEKPFDNIGTTLGEYREGHLDIASAEFDDRVELYITDGLGNYSVVRVKIKKGEAHLEIERYKPDLMEDKEFEQKKNKSSVEFILFEIRSID
ncbi:MAG TPA: hypothetical protein ENI23_07470 [bacterium]|nr:hypothetical protein [bacterium]